jgi:signal transduction histidine kinase
MDAERILQALRNLIGNAVKFTPGGGQVTVFVRAVEKGVSVWVEDTGPGIPREDLDSIFDKFRQATISSYSKIKGTGLGLAIVKHIINAHGGKVWVESQPGRGSIFIFLLPA